MIICIHGAQLTLKILMIYSCVRSVKGFRDGVVIRELLFSMPRIAKNAVWLSLNVSCNNSIVIYYVGW